jgi:diguanylate cyclase (GGDEF)-like protein
MARIPDEFLKRIEGCTSFPTPPAIALKVIQLAQDPGVDLAVVANACSSDPAIAAKVLKIANSAFYGSRRKSANLRQALIILGLNATLTLALSFTLVSALRSNPNSGFDLTKYWRRAILAASWGKTLAAELGRKDAEEIFIAALLQDIGMLAIDRVAPEVFKDISPFDLEHTKALCQHERNCLQTDHPAIGAWLLESWNMPKHLPRALAFSHDPDAAAAEPAEREFFRIVAISAALADVWLAGGDEASIRRAGNLSDQQLGILPNRMAELFETIEEQLPVAQEIFEMELFDAEQLQNITDTAREILMIRNLHALSEAATLQKQTSRLRDENSALKDKTNKDALTGVHSRRFLTDSLDKEFAAAVKHQWPLSLIFIDIDLFKEINDTYGHQAGDATLQSVASLLSAQLRDSDIVARYGGDEFVLLLPGTDATNADLVASRIINAIQRHETVVESASFSVTLSAGIATYDSQSKFSKSEDLLAAADRALYHAKSNGRNRHTCYESIEAA